MEDIDDPLIPARRFPTIKEPVAIDKFLLKFVLLQEARMRLIIIPTRPHPFP